ncbi:hypothetical protein PS854_00304 [Pseudomonas fluorescens]|uniref:Uncharacterized protein n=1 Tax=Pseudomonas fluorescens TaxID=294 RepID=A0A5E7GIG6_PSEFL|nr:hypothetical protein PS854_00304 [Pseudomonas fluorescens]
MLARTAWSSSTTAIIKGLVKGNTFLAHSGGLVKGYVNAHASCPEYERGVCPGGSIQVNAMAFG